MYVDNKVQMIHFTHEIFKPHYKWLKYFLEKITINLNIYMSTQIIKYLSILLIFIVPLSPKCPIAFNKT